ncbi:hypothetical protein A3A95_00545 [Candidatus Nomurabacteria bacterium RIFCSPLOWO2_01_FULL_39_18]|nr:MAG: hypothetical protein A3A95_00545 [Candidatus Nomurabacteria bacterium RIFCSPLOWO2_01_FULL_39_18]
MPKRIFAFIILLFSVLFLPFWISIILAVVGIFYFSYFFEAVGLLALSDLLYGVKDPRFLNLVFFSGIISFIFLLAVELFKKKLKFYPKN